MLSAPIFVNINWQKNIKLKERDLMAKHNGTPELRIKNGFPIACVKDIEKDIFNIASKFDFSDFKFCRQRIFNFKNVLFILLTVVLRGYFTISDVSKNISGKCIFNIDLANFTKQALFKKLRLIDPLWFKKVLFFFVKNTNARNSSLDIHPHKLRAFNRILKVDLSRLDRCPNNKFIITSDSISFNKFYSKLGGVILTCTNLLNEKLCYIHYHQKASRNDLAFKDILYSWLKKNDLICFDRGYNNYKFFNEIISKGVSFIQPLHPSARYEIIKVMYQDNMICDSLIILSKSKKVKTIMRLVSVKIENKTHKYITSVTDTNKLNAKDIFLLYEKRWNIEKTFNYVKRTLNLSYLWSSDPNIIEIQVYITFIIYNVMLNLIGDVSKLLNTDPERISFHMIKKSFFLYTQHCDDYDSFLDFLVINHKKLDLIKPVKNYQKLKKELIYLAFCESLF